MMPIPARAHPGMPPEVPGIAGGATVVVVTITAAPSVMERWDWVATGAWVETVPVPEGTTVVLDTVVVAGLPDPELPLLTELLLTEDPPPPPPL